MPLSLLPEPIQSYEDSNGKPLNGGQLFTYAAGTTTPKATYQDSAGAIPNTNPIILNERGEATAYGSGNYRFVLKNSAGATIWDRDNVNAAISASDLSGNDGASLIGYDGTTLDQFLKFRLLRVVDTISQLRALDKTKYTRAFVSGYYAAGDGGGGPYWFDSTDTTSADNNGTIIVATDGGRWKLMHGTSWASVCQFGAKGDGTTDDSVAIQKAVDAMKGKLVVIDAGKTFLCAGITLDGGTYNNTRIDGRGMLLLKADGGNSNFGGGWVGILIRNCGGVKANLRWNGNRTVMTAREQIICVGLAGAADVEFPSLEFNELRGDGLYIGQLDWTSSSANTSRVKIGSVTALNSVNDGRNTISIISGSYIDIDTVRSINIGGTINGFIMPGGIDIEPDQGYQTCANIHIGYAEIVTAGTAGLGVFGKSISGNDANRDWNCFGIRIDNCSVLKTGTSGSALSATPFTRVADLKVRGTMAYDSARGAGPVHDYSQRVDADWTVNNVTNGVVVGPVNTVTDFAIRVAASNYNSAGLRVSGAARGRFTGRVFGAVGGLAFAVQCHDSGRAGLTQVDVAYEVDSPFDGTALRAFRNEPGNLISFGAGCVARNCDWTGYANHGATNDATIRTENVLGWTNSSTIPTSGVWFLGTFVKNDGPIQSGGKIMIGWSRLNTGSNNVLNNDWSQVFATIT